MNDDLGEAENLIQGRYGQVYREKGEKNQLMVKIY